MFSFKNLRNLKNGFYQTADRRLESFFFSFFFFFMIHVTVKLGLANSSQPLKSGNV